MISNQDRTRIGRAARAALSSNYRVFLGAVLVSGGRTVAVGSNRFRNDARVVEHTWTTHAEEAVLRLAGEVSRRSTIYIARIDRNGAYALARPCPQCAVQLVEAGVSRVVYTTNEGTIVEERAQDILDAHAAIAA